MSTSGKKSRKRKGRKRQKTAWSYFFGNTLGQYVFDTRDEARFYLKRNNFHARVVRVLIVEQ